MAYRTPILLPNIWTPYCKTLNVLPLRMMTYMIPTCTYLTIHKQYKLALTVTNNFTHSPHRIKSCLHSGYGGNPQTKFIGISTTPYQRNMASSHQCNTISKQHNAIQNNSKMLSSNNSRNGSSQPHLDQRVSD